MIETVYDTEYTKMIKQLLADMSVNSENLLATIH